MKNQCKISRWQEHKAQLNNLAPAAFKTSLAEVTEGALLDCRSPAEYAEGCLSGAINIDYLAYDFWERVEKLDKDKTYWVYCRSERRSIRACTLMRNGGFSKVYNLEGGLRAWQETFGSID